ncbi:MAG: tryptophan synthase subunit alpha [Acidobacteria bacterium]|nr:MAG: tryptophan synthase subunit alpha [Acidobacteriota bacterium]
MSRIAERFQRLAADGRKGFIPFVTAGDPSLETSLEIVLKLADLGADVIELGVPFSDPMADGPTIQRSSQRALCNHVTLADVLKLARRFRAARTTPLVLFSYLNPLLSYGFEKLCRDAAATGIDGILITDAVDDEAEEFSRMLETEGLDLISLIAPTTSDERLERIAKSSRGFLYAVSRAGVTGAQQNVSSDASKLVERARKFTGLPIAVGFGISTAEQISGVWRFADAAVVGSAIVKVIEDSVDNDPVEVVNEFVSGLVPQFAKSGIEL